MLLAPVTTPGFDLMAPGTARVAVLVAFRIAGLLVIAPVFGQRTVPAPYKVGLVVLMTVLLQPVALSAAPAAAAPGLTMAPLLAESLLGFYMGLAAALLLGAASMAGDYIAQHIGLAGAASLDPISNDSSPIVGQFITLTTLTLLLAGNFHLHMLEALGASFRLVPPGGGALDLEGGLFAGARLGGELFVLGFRFAAPVLVAGLLGNLGMGLLSRAAPQMNILSLVFPIQIGLGLVCLGLMLPFLGGTLAQAPDWIDLATTRLLDALTASTRAVAPHGAPTP